MQFVRTNRREFITLLGGTAATWPLAAHAQQRTPVIGLLHDGAFEPRAALVAAFRQGLADAGYVEGRNVEIEYRWANDQFDQLPNLARDLVERQVTAIVTPGTVRAAVAAKAATSAIPIIFSVGADPVKLGLVASFNRPGGNATGVSYFTYELGPKRLGLLSELMPRDADYLVLLNPNNPSTLAAATALQDASSAAGQHLSRLEASSNDEINEVFPAIAQRRKPALVIIPDALFTSRRVQLATLAARYNVPTIYTSREFVEVGGLMSYGTNLAGIYRQVGSYAGRVLNGSQPSEIPVIQPTKFELVISLATAKILRLEIPPTLLARADEVIE